MARMITSRARGDATRMAPFVAADDLLDALADAWTARRHADGLAMRLFAEPSTDADGLRMEIVF